MPAEEEFGFSHDVSRSGRESCLLRLQETVLRSVSAKSSTVMPARDLPLTV